MIFHILKLLTHDSKHVKGIFAGVISKQYWERELTVLYVLYKTPKWLEYHQAWEQWTGSKRRNCSHNGSCL